MEQLEKAKMYFELAMEYCPESANAFDSMADYYESQVDFTNAVKHINKAFELSGSDYYKQEFKDLMKKQ